MQNSKTVGVDAGGTLIKIAFWENEELKFQKFPSTDLPAATEWIRRQFPGAEICVTGGKASLFQALMQIDSEQMIEFEATCSGAQYLLRSQSLPADSFILTNVGTGTSVHYVENNRHLRVGGIGVGGGTLMGLSCIMTGMSDYKEIISLSRQGSRKAVDLKVSDIYEGTTPPIPGDLTASNFGKANHPGQKWSDQDLLASVIGVVGETVTTVSILAAAQHGTSAIVYIGSSFVDNDVLRETVTGYTILRGAVPTVLTNGEYSGAIGALLSLNR
ncbi:type II pantothenate kinase [Paenibacillus filicis]|uniref:Type II pantothenate kinase n=1 Tax=Paenibacillus gyeongsangnamensis TaxID=3388067 RepID=A0ABT4QF60_9BACL|nr:type II pantothenate kinase [Paenibacillus filicis]MCZ8515489.1 type II pantothenate kinase [Paenibacillus filicis]